MIILQRMGWNSSRWIEPTGERLGLEASYIGQHGFGHEDWNFCISEARQGHLHGYSYYSPSDNDDEIEEFHDIFFFAIDPDSDLRLLVGYYKNARFLNSTERAALAARYRESALGRRHVRQLRALDLPGLQSDGTTRARLFDEFSRNIRVRADSVVSLERPIVLTPELLGGRNPNFLSRYRRPTFLSAPPLPVETAPNLPDEIRNQDESEFSRHTAARSKVITPWHKRLSNRFRTWLRISLQAENIRAEKNHIDVTAVMQGQAWLFELKSCLGTSPTFAIREALGQLLHYAYYSPHQAPDRLAVVLDESPSDDDLRWLRQLGKMGLKVAIFWQTEDGFARRG